MRYAISTARKQLPSDNETAWNAFLRLALALLVYVIHHKDRLPNIFHNPSAYTIIALNICITLTTQWFYTELALKLHLDSDCVRYNGNHLYRGPVSYTHLTLPTKRIV